MSLRDFWTSVRVGASFLLPHMTVDSPKLDASQIEKALRSAPVWLTPASVDGFHEEDFSFLPDEERSRLANLVRRFQQLAAQVSPNAPAAEETIEQAEPIFQQIVEMLEFDRYADDEAYRIGKQIEQAIKPHRPAELAELRFVESGLDSTGDPALWIWVILTDRAAETPGFESKATAIRKLLESSARQVAPERWPYVRIRTESEQAELAEAMAS